MFQDFKSEIKTLFIVAFIAIVISVAGILLLRDSGRNLVSPTPSSQSQPEVKVLDE